MKQNLKDLIDELKMDTGTRLDHQPETICSSDESEEKVDRPKFTITPANVNDLATRLNFLFFPMLNTQRTSIPFEFFPRDDVCGIELRMFSVVCTFSIDLSNEQVCSILMTASSGLESWASVIRTDLMRMTTEDGSDPRLHKPEEQQ